MTPKFDKIVNSFLKILTESPDNITYNGKNYHYFQGHYTGIIPQNDNSVFLLYDDSKITSEQQDEGERAGHSAFTIRLNTMIDPDLYQIESSNIITNANLKDWVGGKLPSMSCRYRIWKGVNVISFWKLPLKEQFDTALESLKAVHMDPKSMTYDIGGDYHVRVNHFKPNASIHKYDNKYYSYETLMAYFNKISPEENERQKKEAISKDKEQAELEKQIKLKSMGFVPREKKPWQM